MKKILFIAFFALFGGKSFADITLLLKNIPAGSNVFITPVNYLNKLYGQNNGVSTTISTAAIKDDDVQRPFAIGVDTSNSFIYCLAKLSKQNQFQFNLQKNVNQTIAVEFVKHVCGHYFPVCKVI